MTGRRARPVAPTQRSLEVMLPSILPKHDSRRAVHLPERAFALKQLGSPVVHFSRISFSTRSHLNLTHLDLSLESRPLQTVIQTLNLEIVSQISYNHGASISISLLSNSSGSCNELPTSFAGLPGITKVSPTEHNSSSINGLPTNALCLQQRSYFTSGTAATDWQKFCRQNGG
jgi:hypothetical protein